MNLLTGFFLSVAGVIVFTTTTIYASVDAVKCASGDPNYSASYYNYLTISVICAAFALICMFLGRLALTNFLLTFI